ncbi:MAG TPA: SUMF1/EgtB/PvdO family nonheme iron enzyme, partial [Verrucomicrobiaceae bacterium]
EIVNRAMQDQREARYASAVELRADLTTILEVPTEGASSARSPKVGSRAMRLIGPGAAAVCAIGLILWRPWSNSGGRYSGNPVPRDNQSEAHGAKISRGQEADPRVPGGAAHHSEIPVPATVDGTVESKDVAATPTDPNPKMSPPAGGSTESPVDVKTQPAVVSAGFPSGFPESNTSKTNRSLVTEATESARLPAAPAAHQPNARIPVSAATLSSINLALPRELAALDAQFQNLQAERVTTPFETEVAKLNTGYIGGLEREMATEKAAGHLDAVLALDAEKMLVREKQPVPGLEEEESSGKTTPGALKQLRSLYREAHAKLEAQLAANLKPLTDPLTARLVSLESELTKKDRIADAKVVREYRESLASALAEGATSAEIATATGRTIPPNPITPRVGAGVLRDGFINSLGMTFKHVTGTKVFFCIHITRVQDYRAYAAEVPGVNGSWKPQNHDGVPVDKEGDHPVVRVSWDDANAFCAWLSKKEGHTYRLPTDREWSFAVGIGPMERVTKDTTPERLSSKIKNVFPWGKQWPPPKGAGNYADTATREMFPTQEIIAGYTDGFATTSPVMSFNPNKLGLYDMGGNVWQWCEDCFGGEKDFHVSRGASWKNYEPEFMLSSERIANKHDAQGRSLGFRCVIVAEAGSTEPAPQIVAAPKTKPVTPTVGALTDGFTNTLGMKFKHVTGTKVLFCIHTTRVKDYAAYAAAVDGVKNDWKSQMCDGIPVSRGDDYPVVGVNWDDANAFCAWLSKKEGHTYRLPTDREWSFAVGIGLKEKVTKDTTPESLNGKVPNVFPWGSQWPPQKGAGNFSDTTCKEKFPAREIIAGYMDGFATTAPVMSFKPNTLGLYDMGGNVWQWCEDWINGERKDRVLRGGSWTSHEHSYLLSSTRHHLKPMIRSDGDGFRVVVVSNG